MASEQQVRAIKRRHARRLLAQPGVCGVGIERDATGQFVLTVHLAAADAAAGRRVPAQIEGVPVKLVASGPFQKLEAEA